MTCWRTHGLHEAQPGAGKKWKLRLTIVGTTSTPTVRGADGNMLIVNANSCLQSRIGFDVSVEVSRLT